MERRPSTETWTSAPDLNGYLQRSNTEIRVSRHVVTLRGGSTRPSSSSSSTSILAPVLTLSSDRGRKLRCRLERSSMNLADS